MNDMGTYLNASAPSLPGLRKYVMSLAESIRFMSIDNQTRALTSFAIFIM